MAGLRFAQSPGMAGWNDFREIAAWQHSESAKIRVYALLERPRIKCDFRLATQLRESARSAPANIAEGFGRFGSKEFARFARIAKGSLHESMNHLIDARDQRLITEDELLVEEHHIKKAINAVTGLIRHLETHREPEPRTARRTEPRTEPTESRTEPRTEPRTAPRTKNPTEPNSEPGTRNR